MAASSSHVSDLNLPSDPEEEEEEEEVQAGSGSDSASGSNSEEENDSGSDSGDTASFFSDSEEEGEASSSSSSSEDERGNERPTPFPKVIPLVSTAIKDVPPTLKNAETRMVPLKSFRMFFKTPSTSFHVDFNDPLKSTEWAIVDLTSEDGAFKALEFFRITQDIIVRMNEQELHGHVVPLHTQTITVFSASSPLESDETAVANIVFRLDQGVGKTETYSAPCTANHQLYVSILRVAENKFKIAKLVIVTPPPSIESPPESEDGQHAEQSHSFSPSSEDEGGEGGEGENKDLTKPEEVEEESDDITLSDIDGMF